MRFNVGFKIFLELSVSKKYFFSEGDYSRRTVQNREREDASATSQAGFCRQQKELTSLESIRVQLCGFVTMSHDLICPFGIFNRILQQITKYDRGSNSQILHPSST